MLLTTLFSFLKKLLPISRRDAKKSSVMFLTTISDEGEPIPELMYSMILDHLFSLSEKELSKTNQLTIGFSLS
jgi:hypothetical protein